ncbi:hypothetical protein OPV22_002898 [Ensete ventricosum]|uniref:Uncharacterized protein n=1 Tax=Ensete ventricosum TaxID=4639 RepID=A0AAV8RZ97_ENSVE|nr:hypothetical protein OPV22_002898 [Ensete ventricosum]
MQIVCIYAARSAKKKKCISTFQSYSYRLSCLHGGVLKLQLLELLFQPRAHILLYLQLGREGVGGVGERHQQSTLQCAASASSSSSWTSNAKLCLNLGILTRYVVWNNFLGSSRWW